jgi:sugar lactone lactonase YvrE
MNEPRTLIAGIAFGESPRWHDEHLWFSDWGTQEIIAVDLEGNSAVMVRLSFPWFQPICFDWLPDGRLLIVSASDGLLLRLEPDGALVTHSDLSSLADGFNEIVVYARGNAYVNSGNFDFATGAGSHSGVVAPVHPDGSARQVAEDIVFGNGIAITEDGSTLIVAESWARRLSAFDIARDGGLSNRRVWADLGDSPPDGICTDAKGAVWFADVPNKRCTRVREGGEVLQTFELDRGCFACALGGTERRTLFMVTREWRGPEIIANEERTGQILTARAPAPGAGRP